MADDGGDSEYGEQERDGYGSDDAAHEDDHEGLDEGGAGADGVLELFFEKDGDAVTDHADLAGLFAGAEHLEDAGADQFPVGREHDGVGKLVAVADAGIDMQPELLKEVIVVGDAHDLQGLQQADAGVDHGGEDAHAAGHDGIVEHGAENGHVDLDPAECFLPGLGAFTDHKAPEPEGPDRDGKGHKDGIADEVAAVDQDLGEFGQRCAAGLVDFGKPREDEKHQRTGGGDGHQQHDERVDHGAFDLFAGFGVGVEVAAEDVEHLGHFAGGFGSLDHADEHAVEDAGIGLQGRGEAVAVGDAMGNIQDDLPEHAGAHLVGNRLDGIAEDHPAVEHDR